MAPPIALSWALEIRAGVGQHRPNSGSQLFDLISTRRTIHGRCHSWILIAHSRMIVMWNSGECGGRCLLATAEDSPHQQ
jgi:hypothetical protein